MKKTLLHILIHIEDIISLILMFAYLIILLNEDNHVYGFLALIPFVLLSIPSGSNHLSQNKLKDDPDIYVNTEETIKYRFFYDKDKIKGPEVSYYYVCYERLSRLLYSLGNIADALYIITFLFFYDYIIITIILITIQSIIHLIVWFSLPKRFPKIAAKKYPQYEVILLNYKNDLKE